MRSFPVCTLLAALTLATPAFSQESAATLTEPAKAAETAAIAATQFATFERGDGMLSLTLGATVPLGFYNPTTASFEGANSTPGFAFSLSYAGFINDSWALAGDLAGGYVSTVNARRLFIAPLSLRLIKVFPLGSFVIAPSAGLGLAISALGDYKHVDPLLKAGSSFMWRASTDMSYALNLFANVIPQIFADSNNTRVGLFMEATLSVAYHL